MHHNNFGNFYTREIYAIPIPTGFIPIPIPIMSRMAFPPMGMGFPWGFPLPCTPLQLSDECAFESCLVSTVSPKAPRKPAVAKPAAAAAATADLPTLASVAPKLQHLCTERPRRAKNRAVTRPTVGLTRSDDVVDEEAADDVDVFFSSLAAKPLTGNLVNGELEKG